MCSCALLSNWCAVTAEDLVKAHMTGAQLSQVLEQLFIVFCVFYRS